MEWLIQVPVLFFSIIFHEFAHGAVAFRRGDDTAYLSGRLTLNPLPHIDPIGTIILPAICLLSHFPAIGWAKPVPVNPLRMGSPRRDMAFVAMAGPSANLLLAVLALFAYKSLALGLFGADLTQTLAMAFFSAIQINVLLAAFNLIPIFPLDGSHIAIGFMPDSWLEVYERHIPYGMYLILGLVVTGLLQKVLYPILSVVNFFLSLIAMAF